MAAGFGLWLEFGIGFTFSILSSLLGLTIVLFWCEANNFHNFQHQQEKR